jgi:hypothetical protein
VALLKLPEDALHLGKLEYTKAIAVERVKGDRRRQELLEKSVSLRLAKSKIWEDSEKLKELEKYLDSIKNLLK